MKTIGIIGAMDEEIAVLKPRLEMISAKSIVGMEFYLGKLCGKNTALVRSGIGKVNAAVCTQVLCDLYGVDMIINTGVAGALIPELNICDIVISKDVVNHDFNAGAFGYEPGVIPRMPVSMFPADAELIALAEKACAENVPERKSMTGRIASGDLFVSSDEAKNRIRELFGAYCVEMEGAAIGQACYLNKIPFIVIRTISDKASGSADEEINTFVDEAAGLSCTIVESMIKMI